MVRLEMALHDYAPLRTMAFGMAGMSVVTDSLSAIRYAKVRVVRNESGLITDYQTEGSFPKFGNNDNRVDHFATWVVGVEKVAFGENSRRFGDRKCPAESRKSLVGHPGAMKFLSIS